MNMKMITAVMTLAVAGSVWAATPETGTTVASQAAPKSEQVAKPVKHHVLHRHHRVPKRISKEKSQAKGKKSEVVKGPDKSATNMPATPKAP